MAVLREVILIHPLLVATIVIHPATRHHHAVTRLLHLPLRAAVHHRREAAAVVVVAAVDRAGHRDNDHLTIEKLFK